MELWALMLAVTAPEVERRRVSPGELRTLLWAKVRRSMLHRHGSENSFRCVRQMKADWKSMVQTTGPFSITAA